MGYVVLAVLTLCFGVSLNYEESGAYPVDPTVLLRSDVNITCYYPHQSAAYIQCCDRQTKKEILIQTRALNDSVSVGTVRYVTRRMVCSCCVSIQNTSCDLYTSRPTSCDFPGGTTIQGGYPPEKPRDITYIASNFDSMNVSFDPGRDPLIPTNYTLYLKYGPCNLPCEGIQNDSLCPTNCTYCMAGVGRCRGGKLCSLQCPQFARLIQFFTHFCLVIDVHNALGRSRKCMDHNARNLTKFVKASKPTSLISTAINSTALALSFDIAETLIQIQDFNKDAIYRLNYTSRWNENQAIQIRKSVSIQEKLALYNLHPDTTYTITLQLKPYQGLYWSDPVTVVTNKTLQAAPSAPPNVAGVHCDRLNCKIYWTCIPPVSQNGDITMYKVDLKRGKDVIKTQTHQQQFPPINIQRDAIMKSDDNVYLNMNARTSVGFAAYGRYYSLKTMKEGIMNPTDVAVESQKNGSVFISWSPPEQASLEDVKYNVLWCKGSYNKGCVDHLHLLQEPINTTSVTLTLADEVSQSYMYGVKSIHSEQDSMVVLPDCKCTFDYFGIPFSAPKLSSTVTSTSVEVEWQYIPKSADGKITGFILETCRLEGVNCEKKETNQINPKARQFTLEKLKPSSVYNMTFWMTTRLGRSKNPFTAQAETQVRAQDKTEEENVAVIIGSVIGSAVLLIITAGCITYYFRKCTKTDIKIEIPPEIPSEMYFSKEQTDLDETDGNTSAPLLDRQDTIDSGVFTDGDRTSSPTTNTSTELTPFVMDTDTRLDVVSDQVQENDVLDCTGKTVCGLDTPVVNGLGYLKHPMRPPESAGVITNMTTNNDAYIDFERYLNKTQEQSLHNEEVVDEKLCINSTVTQTCPLSSEQHQKRRHSSGTCDSTIQGGSAVISIDSYVRYGIDDNHNVDEEQTLFDEDGEKENFDKEKQRNNSDVDQEIPTTEEKGQGLRANKIDQTSDCHNSNNSNGMENDFNVQEPYVPLDVDLKEQSTHVHPECHGNLHFIYRDSKRFCIAQDRGVDDLQTDKESLPMEEKLPISDTLNINAIQDGNKQKCIKPKLEDGYSHLSMKDLNTIQDNQRTSNDDYMDHTYLDRINNGNYKQ